MSGPNREKDLSGTDYSLTIRTAPTGILDVPIYVTSKKIVGTKSGCEADQWQTEQRIKLSEMTFDRRRHPPGKPSSKVSKSIKEKKWKRPQSEREI